MPEIITDLFTSGEMHMWVSILIVVVALLFYSNDKIHLEITSIFIIGFLLIFFYLFPLLDNDGKSILDSSILLRGFSNPALIAVLCLLILGQALVQNGALNHITSFIMKISGHYKYVAITASLVFVALVSAILNNTPVVVIFIPILLSIAKSFNFSASKIMIPLSFASILGGMTTLIGSSTNILVSGILNDIGYEQLGFFDFTFFGAMLAGVGLIYVIFILPNTLKDRSSYIKDYSEENNKRQFVAQIEIDYNSDLVGKNIGSDQIKELDEVSIKMLVRGEHSFLSPFEDLTIKPNDTLIITSSKEKLKEFFVKNHDTLEKKLANKFENEDEITEDISMAEIIVTPASRYINKNLEEIRFRSKYRCYVLGIQRHTRPVRTKISENRLSAGDVLMVTGKKEDLLALHQSSDFLLLEWTEETVKSGNKGIITSLIFAGVVGLAATNILPIVISAFLGVAMVISMGCMNLRQMVRALDLKIFLIIPASLAMGTAMQITGAAHFLADNFVKLLHGAEPIFVMSALFIVMIFMTNILSNNATAVLFTPIALNLADTLQADPKMFIFAVVFASNCSFLTPIGYQTNMMVMGPGHYRFADFTKAGVPLAILMWLGYTTIAWIYF